MKFSWGGLYEKVVVLGWLIWLVMSGKIHKNIDPYPLSTFINQEITLDCISNECNPPGRKSITKGKSDWLI